VVHAAGGAFCLVNRREHVDRAEKRELVSELNGVFTKTSVVVVAHYSGLTASPRSLLMART
jgi:large subunit ribosomal protein L10